MRQRDASDPPDSAELLRRREDAFRPARFLGYNHNTLGVYLIERGAFAIAEVELRRAIWLNPYEPAFMANLAWCLFKQGQDDEARKYLNQAIEEDKENPQVRHIAHAMGFTVKPVDTRGENETET